MIIKNITVKVIYQVLQKITALSENKTQIFIFFVFVNSKKIIKKYLLI